MVGVSRKVYGPRVFKVSCAGASTFRFKVLGLQGAQTVFSGVRCFCGFIMALHGCNLPDHIGFAQYQDPKKIYLLRTCL